MKLIPRASGGSHVACDAAETVDGETENCPGTHFRLIKTERGELLLQCELCDERWAVNDALVANKQGS